MSPKELIAKVESVMETLALWKGHLVNIKESLSRSRHAPCPHDRHCATRSAFTMRVEHCGVAISGTSMFLIGASGESPASYELTLDCVVAIDNADPDTIVIVEHFERETERKTIFCRGS